MTCIDSAIIKALVEHIGGNPDDVVVGGGGSTQNTLTKLSATFKADDTGALAVDLNLTDLKYLKSGKLIIKTRYAIGGGEKWLLIDGQNNFWTAYNPPTNDDLLIPSTYDTSTGLLRFTNKQASYYNLDVMNNDAESGIFVYNMEVPTGEDMITFMQGITRLINSKHT